MILRVYAMYSRSKTVLCVLLVFYVATIILYAASGGFYNNPDTYMSSKHHPHSWKNYTHFLSLQ